MHDLKTAGYLDDTIFYINLNMVREGTDEVEKLMWELCVSKLKKERDKLINDVINKVDRSTIKI